MKYLVEERGFSRHDGEFYTVFGCADTPEKAIKIFEALKTQFLSDDNFFLKDGECEESTTITMNGAKLPLLEITDEYGNEWYELFVAETNDLEEV